MTERYRIYVSDALEWLSKMPTESIDLVITDVPYESLEKHRSKGTTTRLKQSKGSSNEWFKVFPNSLFPELFKSFYRILRDNRHLYFFCDQETMFVAKPIAEEAGFKFWKPLVWDKKAICMGYHYRARYELILFFEKGKRAVNDDSVSDIIEVKRIYSRFGDVYPTEKPVAVSKTLILQSTKEHEIVCDPFMGSGSVGVAALELGRRFLGCDISMKAYARTRLRCDQALFQGKNNR